MTETGVCFHTTDLGAGSRLGNSPPGFQLWALVLCFVRSPDKVLIAVLPVHLITAQEREFSQRWKDEETQKEDISLELKCR